MLTGIYDVTFTSVYNRHTNRYLLHQHTGVFFYLLVLQISVEINHSSLQIAEQTFCSSKTTLLLKVMTTGWPWRKMAQKTIVYFIHLVVCLTTGPKPLPKRALHIVRSRASSLKWEYPLLSLRSSNSFLRLLPCLPVTSIPPCIFPSVTRCRRQFLRKIWPI
jgi:hypothetical protein